MGSLHADDTAKFLTARPVQNFIRIGYVGDKDPRLVYAVDSYKTDDEKTLTKDLTLRTEDEVQIYIAKYNPLRDSFTINTKETPSPNYEALKAFLADLQGFIKTFEKAPTGAGTLGQADSPPEREPCAELRKRIDTINEALRKNELTAAELKRHVDAAIGFDGVTSAIANLKTVSNNIENNVKIVENTTKSIIADYSGLGADKPKKACAAIASDVLVDYLSITSTAGEILTRKRALKKALDDVVKNLEPLVATDDDWRGEDELTDYALTRFTPTFETDRTVSVTAIRRTIEVKDGVLTVGAADATKRDVTFLVKRDSFFVAERAAAAVYNQLKYPQYGTAKNDAGETVVERSKDDHDPINAAMMLNLVMRTPRMGSVAYPMLQIGVSTAKDFPGLLAGIGLRFTQPSAFSLSVGGMITRYKDLDGTLKEGQTVEGTADIEAHLEYKWSPVVLYGAIQIKF